jgi:ribulose-5-phosphate 4-epimerase/fuculose-1-phosphate aldolase
MEPLVGAYDPAVAELAVNGVPTYLRAVLISDRELGGAVADAMGDADVCLLRGHGIVAVGDDVQQATIRAIKLETLAEWTLRLRSVPGVTADPMSAEDIDAVTGFVSSQNAAKTHAHWTWDFYRRSLGDAADVTNRDALDHTNSSSRQGGAKWHSS